MNNRTKLLQFLLCVTLIFLQLSFINAQNAKIDSLQKINLNYNKSDKKKVDILNELSHTISPFDITLAKEYAESAKAISEEINYINGLCNSYNNLGSTYRVSNKEMALDYFTKGLYLSKENNFNSIVNSLIGIGNIKYRQNFINEADSLYKEAYDLSIKFKDDLLIAKSLFNMSIIESKKLNYKEVINLLVRA